MITCPLAFCVDLVHHADLCFNRGRSKKLPPDIFVRKACLQIRSKLAQNVWWSVPTNRWKPFAQLTRRGFFFIYNLPGKYYHVFRRGLCASWRWPCWNQAGLRRPRFPPGKRGLSTWWCLTTEEFPASGEDLICTCCSLRCTSLTWPCGDNPNLPALWAGYSSPFWH